MNYKEQIRNNNLREIRKSCGLRQTDVAEQLGLKSADRISRWEKGQSVPSIINLFKLSMLYKCSAEEFYKNLIANMR